MYSFALLNRGKRSMQTLRLAGIVLVIFAMLGTIVCAQTSRGTITGVVTDPSRASVQGAKVEITQKETNVSRSTDTNDRGVYRFDAVDPGTYNVTIKAAGFRTYTSRDVPVSAAAIVGVDAAMEVGDNVSVI